MKCSQAPLLSGTRGSAGFTLVELAICLCIVGLLAGGFLDAAGTYFKVEKTNETRHRMDFVMNVLSAYAQTHYRLPCPADPTATDRQAGEEEDNGKCFVTGGNAALYRRTEGILPWKELAIPQNMAMDAWGRYITYKPAPNLTMDMQSPAMQDLADKTPLDIHNACRTANWYDAFGNHANRAKALFCCNEAPRNDYLSSGTGQKVALDDSWRKWGVLDAASAAAIEPAAGGSLPDAAPAQMTNGWTDSSRNPAVNGSFSMPRYMDGPQAPLIRATGLAVVLISHGSAENFVPEQQRQPQSGHGDKSVWPPQMFAAVLNNTPAGNGDIVSWQRSDQLFARVGSGSCETSPAAVLPSYSCTSQTLTKGGSIQPIRDPKSGKRLFAPPLYNVRVGLAGKKYQLRISLTKNSGKEQLYDDSLGFYEVGRNGLIKNVRILVKNVNGWAKNETRDFGITISRDSAGIGIFLVPDGFNLNDGYKNIGLSHLKFVSGYALFGEKDASITDQVPPILVSVDPVSGAETAITGAGRTSAYHLYSNLNPGHASHIMQPDAICHAMGQMVGVNGDISCLRRTALANGKSGAAGPFAEFGFNDSPNINCYEYRDGSCREHDSKHERDMISDGEGGFIASIGQDNYDDVAFSMGFSACPQGR